MRTIRQSTRFKKDFKRELKSVYRETVAMDLLSVLQMLSQDIALPEKFRDHSLSGEWFNFRDCHIKPDLVLIYRKPDSDTLELARLGSHSELRF